MIDKMAEVFATVSPCLRTSRLRRASVWRYRSNGIGKTTLLRTLVGRLTRMPVVKSERCGLNTTPKTTPRHDFERDDTALFG
jgi:ABC-type transport system involved in cytochrome c biogenesis ATPase subunit